MQRSPWRPRRLWGALTLLRLLLSGSLVFSDDCATADLPEFPASEPDLDKLPAVLPNHHAVTYRCKPGFKLVPVRLNTTICTKGVWSPIQDICGWSCPFPPILNNAEIKDEFKSLRDFPVGKVIEYVCHQETDKIPTITITCGKNYKWSEPKVFCEGNNNFVFDEFNDLKVFLQYVLLVL
ncbi:complement decay-accelerating factor-like [Varanus komodoensis]|uniref:complement decay-accelerating factor-like n=1 Tax=Varanus komodoensis TaxID=61221 RepID=UPI001CF78958|nr:complement decay-accelerating factor-like [Varanus komodoensis]